MKLFEISRGEQVMQFAEFLDRVVSSSNWCRHIPENALREIGEGLFKAGWTWQVDFFQSSDFLFFPVDGKNFSRALINESASHKVSSCVIQHKELSLEKLQAVLEQLVLTAPRKS